MSKQLGPIDISCDAPPYTIVQACHQLGFSHPEDVRWSRLGQFLHEKYARSGAFGFSTLEAFFTTGSREGLRCSCGQGLPQLERYTFVLLSGRELSYLLGQCGRCRSMFWEEP